MKERSKMERIGNIGENMGTKTLMGLVAGVFGYLAGRMTELIIVLAIMIILDYILGIVAGLKTKGFNSKTALWGTVKKLCYGILVMLGFLIDFVIKFAAENAGVAIPISGVFGFAVIIYLIGTEGFSCIQNLLLIGVNVPAFIEKAFGLLRDTAGNLVKVNEVEEKENENTN